MLDLDVASMYKCLGCAYYLPWKEGEGGKENYKRGEAGEGRGCTGSL